MTALSVISELHASNSRRVSTLHLLARDVTASVEPFVLRRILSLGLPVRGSPTLTDDPSGSGQEDEPYEYRRGSKGIGRLGQGDPLLRDGRLDRAGRPQQRQLPALYGGRCPCAALYPSCSRSRFFDRPHPAAARSLAGQSPRQRRREAA